MFSFDNLVIEKYSSDIFSSFFKSLTFLTVEFSSVEDSICSLVFGWLLRLILLFIKDDHFGRRRITSRIGFNIQS